MKHSNVKAILFCLFVSLILSTGYGWSQKTDYNTLAANIVKNVAQIKPGEQVVVYGGKHLMDLLELIAQEVNLNGGNSIIVVNSDKVDYTYFHDVPVEYLKTENTTFTSLWKNADVVIALPSNEDFKSVYQDIPLEKFEILQRKYETLYSSLNDSKVREVYVRIPKQELAANHDIPFDEFNQMYWTAISANTDDLKEKSAKISGMMRNCKKIKITSEDGTDFTCDLVGRPCVIKDGSFTPEKMSSKRFDDRLIEIPAGTLIIVPDETSGTGTLVSPNDQCNFKTIHNVKFSVKNGLITSWDTENEKDCLNEVLQAFPEDGKRLGYIVLGYNSMIKKPGKDASWPLQESEGMVTIGFGNNQTMGGNNKSNYAYFLALPNATVELDGKVLIRNGKLEL